jgi:hypothetical protein
MDFLNHRGGMVFFQDFFPPFDAFLILVSMGKRCIYMLIKCDKRKKNATFEGKQRDNVDKAKPPSTFSCFCRNFKSKETMGGGGLKTCWWR